MSSFIEDYMLICEGSEPAVEYHTWSMLSALSAFAGRRFWFPFGPLNYYTNLYVCLVGDAGNRKSTAMNKAKGIVRAAKICPIAATQASKESISQEMSSDKFGGKKFFDYNGQQYEYNQYAIFATELTQFIAINALGMLDFLTTVWDEPIYEVKTKNKGDDYVMGPYITMCACLTPELLKGFIKQNILTGGFARRTAFVFAGYKKVVPIPTYTQAQKDAELRLVQFGQEMQQYAGPFTWTEELQAHYIAWNQKNEDTLRERPPNVRGWYQSKAEMLFKISMLVALAMDKGKERILRVQHYKMAEAYCSMLEKNLERVFEGAGINPNAQAAVQVVRMLEAMDRPMNKKKIMALFFDQVTSLQELKDTLTHLVAVGRLVEKTLLVNGQTLGTLIGSPATMNRPDVELARYLAAPDELPPE